MTAFARVSATPGTPPRALRGSLLRTVRDAARPDVRGLRVLILLGATALMSVIDLALTLTYVTSVGMIELNPFARMVMASNSTAMVMLWKLGLTAACVVILGSLRKHLFTECAAWVCFLVMLALSFKWFLFVGTVANIANDYGHVTGLHEDHRWVMMDAEQ